MIQWIAISLVFGFVLWGLVQEYRRQRGIDALPPLSDHWAPKEDKR